MAQKRHQDVDFGFDRNTGTQCALAKKNRCLIRSLPWQPPMSLCAATLIPARKDLEPQCSKGQQRFAGSWLSPVTQFIFDMIRTLQAFFQASHISQYFDLFLVLYPVHQVTTTLGRQVTALAKPTFAETTASPALGLFRLYRCPTVFWDHTWFICKKTHCWFPCFPPWKTPSLIDLTVQISSKAGSEEISWNIYVKSHGFYPELFGYLTLLTLLTLFDGMPWKLSHHPWKLTSSPQQLMLSGAVSLRGLLLLQSGTHKVADVTGPCCRWDVTKNPWGSWGLWHLIYIYIFAIYKRSPHSNYV